MSIGKIEAGRFTITEKSIKDTDFSQNKSKEWGIVESRLERCKFENLRVRNFVFGSGKKPTEYIDCSFDGSHIRALVPGRARFIRCSFRNVRLEKWLCNEAEFIDCVFTGTLREINFNRELDKGARGQLGRKENAYSGNNFSGATLEWVAFMGGVDLSAQQLPTGEEYLYLPDAAPVLAAAFAEVENWGEADRNTVRGKLEMAREDVAHGQHQLFLCPEVFIARSPEQEKALGQLREVLLAAKAKLEQPAGGSSGTERPNLAIDRRAVHGPGFVYFRARDQGDAGRSLGLPGGPLTEDSTGTPAFDGVIARAVEPFLVLGALVAATRDVRWHPELSPIVSVWPPEETEPRSIEEAMTLPDGSPWKDPGSVLQELGTATRDSLAAVPEDRLAQVAAQWSRAEAFAHFQDVNPESMLSVVRDLVGLAQRARAADEQLYCWIGTPPASEASH
ncbi:hypothetical protein M8C13_20120 [Crossiella sp. SN42]|uniref:hypothetical protein n=1 Tax=Crossiella sp. SN42 TaxID=2944808 RepID=UPI00207C88D3|nr:hypothetical protein [Crossiella sp. SN42]MCO1578063.1 hypothetical protein [Crossiella sp. SN42]